MNPKTRLMAIQAWRALTPAKQEAERLRQIPVKVARSMAFEGEPVPKGWVDAQRRRYGLPADSSKPAEQH